MYQTALVKSEIDIGTRLIGALEWYLIFISPDVDSRGPRATMPSLIATALKLKNDYQNPVDFPLDRIYLLSLAIFATRRCVTRRWIDKAPRCEHAIHQRYGLGDTDLYRMT